MITTKRPGLRLGQLWLVPDLVPGFLGYLSDQKHLGRKTVLNYGYDLKGAEAAIGVPLLAATEDQLTAWLTQQAKHLKPGSLNRKQISLRGFYRWAQDRGKRGDNPARNLIKARTPKRLPRYLTDAQLEQLFGAIGNESPRQLRLACGLALLRYTGMRSGELLGLDVRDVLRDDPAKPMVRVYGKGSKERLIPLPPQAEAYLAAWLEVRPPGDGPLMLAGGLAVPYGTWRRWVSALAVAAGLPGFTSHRLRHTYATKARRLGISLEQLQQLMGHESVATTQIYACGELVPGTRDALERM